MARNIYFMRRVRRLAGTSKALVASVAAIVALGLYSMQQALRLPADYGIEDFMGWDGTPANAASIGQALLYWRHLPVFRDGPMYYLLLDTFAFIPLYSLLIYGVTAALYARFTPGNRLPDLLWRLAPCLLLVPACDDIGENLAGFSKLGAPVPDWFGWHASLFNRLKIPLLLAALVPALYYMVAWWLGFHSRPHVVQVRRETWRGACGVIGRSRYVLASLALFAGFTLVLAQCRDVVLSLVADDAPFLNRAVAIILNALAAALYAYSCFLWTRLVCMVERGSVPPFSTGAVASAVGYFAQQWARLLALAPALMMVVLLDYVTGDALAALRMRSAPGAVASPDVLYWLTFFVALVVMLCALFVRIRQDLSMAKLACYYNATGIGVLLYGEPRRPAGVPALLQPLAHVLAPTVLPLVALALLLLLRVAPLAGWTMPPPAFAELCLGLTWWLGVAGLLSLIEQRTSIPWGLLLLVVVGVLGLLESRITTGFPSPAAWRRRPGTIRSPWERW